MKYWFCYYQVMYQNQNHVYYHHVIMRCDITELRNIENSDYIYILREYKLITLDDVDMENFIIKSLIRDGESLLKVLRVKIKNKSNESLQH